VLGRAFSHLFARRGAGRVLPSWIRGRLGGHCLALTAGMLLPLGLSPFDIWPLGVVSLLGLIIVSDVEQKAWILVRWYLFSLGMYGVGASWIFVSIHEFGGASVGLAGMLIVAFIATYALTGLVGGGLIVATRPALRVLMFPAVWTGLEWFRGWFLTGFPWLYVGYSHTDSPLASLAPVVGVLGLGFISALIAALVYQVPRWRWWVSASALLVLVALTLACSAVNWVRSGEPVTISLVQGNIDQHLKWRPEMVGPIVRTYTDLSAGEWGRDLIIWPEASVTMFRASAQRLLKQWDDRGESVGTTLLLGIPDRTPGGGFANAAVAVGAGAGDYHKRRLVPFGEYVPLEDYLRGLIGFFDLPMSRNEAGPAQQAPMMAGDLRLSLSICYEVVYPELVRTTLSQPDLFVTISNDTWFGSSIGPKQHLQMARMRAMENGRWMARATNNGITALIDPAGTVRARLPQFQPGVLRGQARIMSGTTPFHRMGHWPVLALCGLMLIYGFRYFRGARTSKALDGGS
jgi:apolipoprotein N-acyltransferase